VSRLTLLKAQPADFISLLSKQLTILGMKNSEERIALQAVEFWSTVCDEEIELAIDAAEVRFSTSAPFFSLLNAHLSSLSLS
jgi:importin subunit beta-1